MKEQRASKQQEDLAVKIWNACQGHTLNDGVVAMVIALRMMLRSWPPTSRPELLAGIIKDLKSVVLKHNV